jgi:hypothetical protein
MKTAGLMVACVTGFVMSTGAQKPQPPEPALGGLLAAAASYLDGYAGKLGAIACEERSHEIAAIGSYGGRTVRSDVVLMGGGPAAWLAFRDVFEVDGSAIRKRDTRLVDALRGPAAGALDAARRINNEGAKHHVGAQNVNRAINAPMLALMFLARSNQSRSDFAFDGMKTIDRVQVGLVTFKERDLPRVLPSADEAAAAGKFWIQPVTGRVMQTELSMTSSGRMVVGDLKQTVAAKITVRYSDQPAALGVPVPIRLDEEYEILAQMQQLAPGRPGSATQTYTGRADFSNFRRIDIDVAAIVR